MRLEITRNFLTPEECAALNEWAMQGVDRGWLDTGISRGQPTRQRLTSRLYGSRFNTPEFVTAISEKIRDHAGVSNAPLVLGHGRDGVVASCIYNGGDVFEHKDPRNSFDLATLRCNVMTQQPEAGGVLFIDGQEVQLNAGDLHCYLASEHSHFVSEVKGGTPRILWMFGACVPADDWDSGAIKFGDVE
jgi:hypothetical protein